MDLCSERSHDAYPCVVRTLRRRKRQPARCYQPHVGAQPPNSRAKQRAATSFGARGQHAVTSPASARNRRIAGPNKAQLLSACRSEHGGHGYRPCPLFCCVGKASYCRAHDALSRHTAMRCRVFLLPWRRIAATSRQNVSVSQAWPRWRRRARLRSSSVAWRPAVRPRLSRAARRRPCR